MQIAVVGLGLIGASIAQALKMNTKYSVHGWNRNKEVLSYALENGFIDGVAEDLTCYDVVFICLPPQVTIDFLQNKKFKDGAIVADICGVKTPIERAVYAQKRNYRYVGTHPMAGKETLGIKNATGKLYERANIIITVCEETDKDAVQTVKELYVQMGAGKITECSVEEHDRQIAYTSQLAHVVSNAYVKNSTAEGCAIFAGGSFRDMTRVAFIDENVWTELFFKNRENLSREIGELVEHLKEYQNALDENDPERMKQLLKDGKEKKQATKKQV